MNGPPGASSAEWDRSADAVSSSVMPKFVIDLPADVIDDLTEHPLPCPPGEYCLPALREAQTRAAERRLQDAALIAQIEAVQDEGHRALSMEEASKQLHVSLRTIERMVADGRLPSIKVGRNVRIPYEAVVLNRPQEPA